MAARIAEVTPWQDGMHRPAIQPRHDGLARDRHRLPQAHQEFDMKQRSPFLATLGLLAAMAAHADVPTRLLGDVVPVAQATRTIQIAPATRYVNVFRGETIRFLANGQQFGYFFDGAQDEDSFDLRQVAPPGILDHPVVAYISPDPYNRWSP
jgi:hypothetical protein